jgi:DNA-binding NarL/FixJ family response regulator
MDKQCHTVKLLIVDDEPDIVDELSEFLTGCDYSCTGSHSAIEACERFRNDPQIGIVLCDLNMPGMNGIQLVQELERIADFERPFEAIIFTGQTESRDVIEAMRAGVSDYFQKPVDMDALLQTIRRLELNLKERAGDYHQLGQLNDKLQSLAESIDTLYQSIHKRRHNFGAAMAPGSPSTTNAQVLDEMPMPAPFRLLSPRQLAVARLVGKGLTNYQIACELGITENTVKLYVSQVLRLTHMHNRTQLALALSPGGSSRQMGLTAH